MASQCLLRRPALALLPVDHLDLYVADDLALLARSRCIAGLRVSEDLT